MPYHVYRGRVRAIARDNLAAVRDVACAEWDAIPDGAVVLPVDDDDWFAPDIAERLARLWDGSGGGCSWTSTYLEVPLQRRHGLEMAVRRAIPQIPPRPHFFCTTNNYALVKAADTRPLATRHIPGERVDARLRRAAAGRAAERHEPHARLADLARPPARGDHPQGARAQAGSLQAALPPAARALPDWCAPYVERMAELMEEVEAR